MHGAGRLGGALGYASGGCLGGDLGLLDDSGGLGWFGQRSDRTGVEGSRHTIAGVFFARLVDVLALAAFALGAAFAFVALVVDAFFGAAFVVVFASVFLGLPAVLVPAGLVALVAFYEELAVIHYESQGRQVYLGSRFLFFGGGRGRFCDSFLLGQLHCARWTCVPISAEHSSL